MVTLAGGLAAFSKEGPISPPAQGTPPGSGSWAEPLQRNLRAGIPLSAACTCYCRRVMLSAWGMRQPRPGAHSGCVRWPTVA